MDEIAVPPESELIERLRKALPKDRSAIAKVAKVANISEGRWRQLAKGYQQATPTTRIAAKAPADTLARMAHAVGATAEQLSEVGRADAAEELEKIINWKKYVRPGFGAGSLRWRMELEEKPESEWTVEDHEFKQAEQREHSRRAQAAAEAAGGEWPPPDEPASRPPAKYGLRPRSFEEIFNEWQLARSRLLNLELEYAIGRQIDPDISAVELAEVLDMLTDTKFGRPWTPPWNPGAEFEEGEEPWKAEFWSYTEAVPSPFGGEGHIYQIGHTYDLGELRQKRELSAHADEVWEEDKARQTAAYHRRRESSNPAADEEFQAWIRRSGSDTPSEPSRLSRMIKRPTAAEPVADVDDLTRNDAPPLDEPLVARPTPRGHTPGKSEQGEAGGEESQNQDA